MVLFCLFLGPSAPGSVPRCQRVLGGVQVVLDAVAHLPDCVVNRGVGDALALLAEQFTVEVGQRWPGPAHPPLGFTPPVCCATRPGTPPTAELSWLGCRADLPPAGVYKCVNGGQILV